MSTAIKRRLEALEQRAEADTGLMLLIVVSVAPGEQDRPIDTLRMQDGPQSWQRAEGEAEDDFKRRVRADLGQQGYAKPVLLLANTDDEGTLTTTA